MDAYGDHTHGNFGPYITLFNLFRSSFAKFVYEKNVIFSIIKFICQFKDMIWWLLHHYHYPLTRGTWGLSWSWHHPTLSWRFYSSLKTIIVHNWTAQAREWYIACNNVYMFLIHDTFDIIDVFVHSVYDKISEFYLGVYYVLL